MPRYDDITEFEPELDGKDLCIGIVMSRFNESIGESLLDCCVAALARQGVSLRDVTLATVPGALEIPIALQRMARTGRFHALIALGVVIRGETYHFELVANESGRGVMEVQLDSGIPIANGILTVDSDEQAQARVNQKGADVARAAVEMARLLGRLK